MQYLTELLHNRVLIISICSWMTAQIIKTIIDVIISKELNLERLVGAGGMPSCHSATVCALATSSGLIYGLGSFAFAISCVFAVVVMYDARGVRRETGNQAVLLNRMMDYIKATEPVQWKIQFNQEKLKELVGHTPLQVVVGALLGIGMAFALYSIL
ncbi:MAG: divergent PAP2 family protein [Lachnospiraceae bacterium]|nr:divergent PAP2 family protein [Parasporobacterium sp.]MBR4169611.1 divergent PAP2 family protein [Lachnospiraceae bacterium]MCR4684034.1 divergent PAP2 family protein [Lachnospiraceae bacterium]